MNKKIKWIIKYALIFFVISSFVGVCLALIKKWPVYKGVYIGNIFVGLLAMFYSSAHFIGLPEDRKKFFTGKIRGRKVNELGEKGWKPAFIGVFLLIIGFLVEALFRK